MMRFYNVISVVPGKEQNCIDDLCRLKTECGIDTFAAMLPAHPESPPLLKKTEEFMSRYKTIRDAVAPKGIHGGILVQSLINHGDRARPETNVPFTKITSADGTVCKECFCPLDRGFQNYARDIITHMAEGNPEFILLDDDFRMNHHRPVIQGCFCELHISALNQKFGYSLTRPELGKILERKDRSSQELRKQWGRVLLDGLVEMSRMVRAAIDNVNPAIRGGICMSSGQAVMVEEIVSSLAGRPRPLVRVGNADYLEGAPYDSATVCLRASRAKRCIPKGVEVISESDTCPHHLYATSANALRHQIAASILHGTEGAKLWITDTRNGENGDGKNYRRMLAESRGFFKTLCDFSKKVEWQGPSVAYPPHSFQLPSEKNDNNPFGVNGCAWGNVLIRLGIPFVETEDAPVRMLSGDAPLQFEKKELASFFRSGLVLEGAAAKYLSDMGFAGHMGVNVENAALRYSYEYFEPADSANGTAGGMSMSHSQMFEARFKEKLLSPLDENLRVLSSYIAAPWYQAEQKEVVAPAVTLYENSLGGRVAVFAQPLGGVSYKSFLNPAFINPKRRQQMAGILDWANSSPLPHAAHAQSCAMMYGSIRNSDELAAAFINYCPDPINPLLLRIPAAGELKEVRQLGNDGNWNFVQFNVDEGNLVRLPIIAGMRDVIVLKIRF